MKYILKSTAIFDIWLSKLRDNSIRNRILAQLSRLENGNIGDHKALGKGLFELRFTYGGGLRIYFTFENNHIVLLLSGGNKSKQHQDIANAYKLLAQEINGNNND